MRKIFRFATSTISICLIGALLTATNVICAEQAEPIYKLGPEDRLKIQVYDLRSGAGEAYQWSALDGEFTVSASGQVSVPLVGDVPASGLSTSDVAHSIAQRLQKRVGLSQLPDATVQVVKYRPFYIMGDVEHNGEFDFRPGLTVLQAIGVAGGLYRPSSEVRRNLDKESLIQAGELSALQAQKQSLLSRKYRLEAIANDSRIIGQHPSSSSNQSPSTEISQADRAIVELEKDSLSSQIDSLKQSKMILGQEILSLESKNNNLVRQSSLAKKDLSQVNELLGKGLAVSPRQLAAEQTVAGYESNLLDVQLARIRAQQELAKVDREILNLQDKRRLQATMDLVELDAKIQDLELRSEVAKRLLKNANAARSSSGGPDARLNVTISRRTPSGNQTIVGDELSEIRPGDVVQVREQSIKESVSSQ